MTNCSKSLIEKLETVKRFGSLNDPLTLHEMGRNQGLSQAQEIIRQHEEQQPMEDVVERVAIAICPWHNNGKRGDGAKKLWSKMKEIAKETYREQAKAAIAAMNMGDAATSNAAVSHEEANNSEYSVPKKLESPTNFSDTLIDCLYSKYGELLPGNTKNEVLEILAVHAKELESFLQQREITVNEEELAIQIADYCDAIVKLDSPKDVEEWINGARKLIKNVLKPYLHAPMRESLSYEQLKHALAATEAELEKLQKRESRKQITDDGLLRALRAAQVSEQMQKPWTYTSWKDGIDITEPTQSLRRFAEAVLSEIEGQS